MQFNLSARISSRFNTNSNPNAGSTTNGGSANLATFPEGLDPNSVPVVDTMSGERHVTFAPGFTAAGYAPVQYQSVSYDLGPSANFGSIQVEATEGDRDWLRWLGLNM